MKYSKELHERVRQNLRMFDYPRFDDGDIDALLDEIERLREERRWIPVSEKLPEAYTPVIVYCSDGYSDVSIRSKNDKGEIVFAFDDVTHWMPLPEPPEEIK